MRARRTALLLYVVGAAALAVPARAQQQPAPPSGKCDLQWTTHTFNAQLSRVQLPNGAYNMFVGGGVTGHCPAQGMTLVADSLEYFGSGQIVHLVGHVHYTEPRATMDSDLLTYFMTEERVLVEGHVHATLPSGTTMQGPRANYFRAVPGIRPQAHMEATGRPTIELIQHDSAGKPAEPVTVIANSVTTQADSLAFASGRVEITRPDVIARGDSAALDNGREFARLMRHPTIEARGDRPFTLSGVVIDLFAHNRLLERVLSKGDAKAVSDDATITADTLDFHMANGRLQRTYAWGPSRAHATSPTFDIVADSLDVVMPDQRLRQVHALRDALAESLPDTTKIHSSQRDRLHADTIYAYFDSTATEASPADSARQPEITRLVALGHARSLYQLAARDTAAVKPAINYVVGRNITVAFANRQVTKVTITDEAAGVYLEPAAPGADTSGARRPTGVGSNGPPGRRGRLRP
jgi:lipopolysaccharide export system protein LptA